MNPGPDFDDETDFDTAARGLVAEFDRPTVTAADGRVVWDLAAYEFLNGDCPDTANPVCGVRDACAPDRGCSR